MLEGGKLSGQSMIYDRQQSWTKMKMGHLYFPGSILFCFILFQVLPAPKWLVFKILDTQEIRIFLGFDHINCFGSVGSWKFRDAEPISLFHNSLPKPSLLHPTTLEVVSLYLHIDWHLIVVTSSSSLKFEPYVWK